MLDVELASAQLVHLDRRNLSITIGGGLKPRRPRHGGVGVTKAPNSYHRIQIRTRIRSRLPSSTRIEDILADSLGPFTAMSYHRVQRLKPSKFLRSSQLYVPRRAFSGRSDFFKVSEEVEEALQTGKPVVALETTIYTHGMSLDSFFS